VIAAIEAACREVLHLNSWMLSELVLALADRLVGTLPEPLRRVMLLSTGGEGIEAALRVAKLSSGRFEVAALTRNWHGVTAGASAVTYAAGRSGGGRLPRWTHEEQRLGTRLIQCLITRATVAIWGY
jgi:2,2-dialkylglycine decarboxylase (pyruvate)